MVAISYCQSDPEYRKDPAHAQSHVKHILKSPAHYLAAKQSKFIPTVSMQMGSALHCLVLEGEDQLLRDFVVKPDGISLATKEGKEWKARAGRKTVLSSDNWRDIYGMADSIRRLEWFDSSQDDYRKYNELSLYWNSDGLDCKCRLDRLVLNQRHGIILDLKTTDTVEPDAFLRKVIGSMNYLFQAAWYAEGVEQVLDVSAEFIFVAIERTAPYTARIFEVSRSMIEEGLAQTKRARQLLQECIKSNEWQQPEITSEGLELPGWFRSPLERATVSKASLELDAAFQLP